jgi:pimeloyl-ACP methyl ester carboxylesterase
MLHQSPLSSATFEAVLEPLAQRGLHAVALDTPGFGMSDPTPRPWTIPDYAAAVWQVADALGFDEVTLLGQHTGAVVACESAKQAPQRVTGIVLQGLPLYDAAEREEKISSYAPAYVPTEDGSHLLVIWDRVLGLYPGLAVEETDRQVLEYLATGPDFATAYRAVFAHEVDTGSLRDVPIALVHGEQDLVHRFTDTVTAALPWAHLDVVPGTDFAPDEYPAEFADAVARWAHTFRADTKDVVAR